ncbi:MAG: DNA repair exonuclease, partial [Oscillospiraceae bacterium]|nr:DNA repair exonuclease [Oscillospiraceae bacterium]
MPSLLSGFRAPDSEMLNIMALHGELGGESYAPIDEKAVGDTNLDYLALGHVHTFSGIKRAGNTFYAYPGCPMGRGFDETGKKGVIIGTVDRGSVDLRFEPLSAREYRIIRAGQKELDGAIPEDGRNTVTRLILTGKWDRKPEIRRLYEKLEDRFYHLTIVDETAPDENIWLGLEEDNLKGLFLRMMREKYDAPDADKRAILLAAEYGMAAFNNREGVEL